MSSEQADPKQDVNEGPVMLVATSLVNPPDPVLNLKIVPRTMPWKRFGIMVGTMLVVFLAAVTIFGPGINAIVYGLILGAGLGFALPYLSPMEDRSLVTWMGLTAKSTFSRKVQVDGERIRMYYGTYPLKRAALGRVRLLPGGVTVKATDHDDRGYPIFGAPKSSRQLVSQQRHSRTPRSRRQLKASPALGSQQQRRSLADLQGRGMPVLPTAKQRHRKKKLTASGNIRRGTS